MIGPNGKVMNPRTIKDMTKDEILSEVNTVNRAADKVAAAERKVEKAHDTYTAALLELGDAKRDYSAAVDSMISHMGIKRIEGKRSRMGSEYDG